VCELVDDFVEGERIPNTGVLEHGRDRLLFDRHAA
jgi:hypothetical protein